MRVVINAINALSPGAFQIVSNLIESLAEIGNGDKFLVLMPVGAGYEKLRPLGGPIVTKFYKWHISKNLGYFTFYLFQYRDAIKKFKPDITLVFGSQNPVCVGVPTVVLMQNAFYVEDGSVSELPWLGRLKKKIEIILFARTVKRTDLFLVESGYIGNRLSKIWGVPASRIRVFLNPVAREFVSAEHKGFDRPDQLRDKFLLIYPSKMYPYKNHRLIMEIARKLKDRRIRDVIFLLTVGEEGSRCAKRFWKEARAEGIEEMVMNIGEIPMEELFRWYIISDALFFPSTVETLGYPLLEAMTVGKPVLAIDLPYARAVCNDAALYFDRRLADQAVNMVLRLKSDCELRESLTKKGYERTGNMPTWKEMGWQYLTLLKNEVKRAKEESNMHGSKMGEGGEQLLA